MILQECSSGYTAASGLPDLTYRYIGSTRIYLVSVITSVLLSEVHELSASRFSSLVYKTHRFHFLTINTQFVVSRPPQDPTTRARIAVLLLSLHLWCILAVPCSIARDQEQHIHTCRLPLFLARYKYVPLLRVGTPPAPYGVYLFPAI